MIAIQNKVDCCGCMACASICSKQCIEIKRDSEGFAYPAVDVQQCRDCGMCDSVCPILKKSIASADATEAYVVQDQRAEIRASSSSGGAFTAIAEYVISKGGTVYGAAYDDDHSVHHIGVNNIVDLERFRGSKYVQSDLSGVYVKIRKSLQNHELVLFSGTPCQVAGLKCFLQKEWDTLITVDLACHGVPSPKLWRMYLDWWKKKENSDFSSVEFRSKKYGYSGSTMRLVFENGHEYSKEPMLQFYKNAMFAGLSLRPSCHKCHFKTLERMSDITIFDCWDVNLFCKEMDDDLGTTAVIVRSKGKDLLSTISVNWILHSVKLETIVHNDGDMIINNAVPHPQRSQFFADMDSVPLEQLNEKYFPMTMKKKLILIVKPILHRLGLLNKIKRKIM